MFRILCVFSLLLFVTLATRDQIVPAAFRAIFPYSSEQKSWMLTFRVNRAYNVSNAVTITTDWAHYYWRTQNATLDPKSKLSNESFAVNQATTFIYHRTSVREFLRYMFRTTIDTKYFTEDDAVRMREIFWNADLIAKNNYTITRPLFKNNSVVEFAKTHKDFGAKFENMSTSFYNLYGSSAARLNWVLQK